MTRIHLISGFIALIKTRWTQATSMSIYPATKRIVQAAERSIESPKHGILSDKIGDVRAVSLLIDAIVWYSDAISILPELATIALVAHTLPTDSPLYRLFVDIFVYETDAKSARAILDDVQVPRGFLLQVLEDQTKLIWVNGNKKVDHVFVRSFTTNQTCRYHLHDEEHPLCCDGCDKKSVEENGDQAQ